MTSIYLGTYRELTNGSGGLTTLSPDVINSLSNGVVNGGELTINADNTKFDISDGRGVIIDSYTDVNNPTIYPVSWTGLTAQTVTNILSSTVSFIFIDKNGSVIQKTTKPTPQDRRDFLYLGQLGHSNNVNIATAIAQPDVFESPISQLRDLFSQISISDGNKITANGANLSLDKSDGFITSLGNGFFTDVKSPNRKNFPPQPLATLRLRALNDGTGTTTTLDPLNYDLGGVITPIAGTKAQNLRVYLLDSGNIVVLYGQTLYNGLSSAIQGIDSEAFTERENVKTGQLLAVISILSTCTDLTDDTRAVIKNVGKFGDVSTGGSGVSASTLQQTYNNSLTPEILTDDTRGALTIRRGSTGGDTDIVLDGLNGAGTQTWYFDGSGHLELENGINLRNSFLSLNAQTVAENNKNLFGANASDIIKIGAFTSAGFDRIDFRLGQSQEEITLDLTGFDFNKSGVDRDFIVRNIGGGIALLYDAGINNVYLGTVGAIIQQFNVNAVLGLQNYSSGANSLTVNDNPGGRIITSTNGTLTGVFEVHPGQIRNNITEGTDVLLVDFYNATLTKHIKALFNNSGLEIDAIAQVTKLGWDTSYIQFTPTDTTLNIFSTNGFSIQDKGADAIRLNANGSILLNAIAQGGVGGIDLIGGQNGVNISGNTSTIDVSASGILITDIGNQGGAKYAADYSAFYTSLSLITKGDLDAAIASSVQYKGGYDASTVAPNGAALTGFMYTVTVAGTGGGYFTNALEVGDVIIAETDNPLSENDWTVVNKDLDAASIKVSYESNPDTNAYTDAEKTKLAGIEAGATADQTGAEIKTLYEAEPNTNAFTDAEKTKLAGIEAGAQTKPELQKTFVLENPDGAIDWPFWKPGVNCTITKVDYSVEGATSIDFNINHSGGTDLWAVDKTATTTETSETVFTDATVTAGNQVRLQTSAAVGTPNLIVVFVTYTED